MGPSIGRRFGLGLLLAVGAMAFAVPSSAFGSTHIFDFSFGAEGSTPANPYPLGSPAGIAVDNSGGASDGDIYVADPTNHWVEKFTPGGGLTSIIGDEVDATTSGDVCVISSGDTCQPGQEGSGPGAFMAPAFIAVDDLGGSSNGDFYVADTGDNLVQKFDESGSLIASWGSGGQLEGSSPSEPFGELAGTAVDGSGNLFVYQSAVEGFMFKFNEAGTFIEKFATSFGTAARGIAVDSTGALYKIRGNETVAKLDATGVSTNEEFDPGPAFGVATDSSNDDLYVAHPNTVILRESGGAELGAFGSAANISSATGVAVDPGLETAYVTDSGEGIGRVDAFGPPPPVPPTVGATTVSSITASSADLESQINPNFFTTNYHFQYVTQAQFEATGFEGALETPEASLSSIEGPQTARAHVGELAPETTYRFRAVADNGNGSPVFGAEVGEITTFSTSLSELPDGRSYEMVSPAQKQGDVFPPDPAGAMNRVDENCPIECLPGQTKAQMPMQSTADGEAIVYEGNAFSGSSAAGANQYLARRNSSGWATEGLSSELFGINDVQGYRAFSSDLSQALLFQIEPKLTLDAASKEGKAFANLYLWHNGALQPVVTDPPPHRQPGGSDNGPTVVFRIIAAGANLGTSTVPAFSHVIFEANDALTGATANAPAAVDGGVAEKDQHFVDLNLYEWFGGQLRLVNVLPGNTATTPGAVAGAGYLADGNVSQLEGPDVDHAISADGNRIFWTDESTEQLYVRINGEETQEIHDAGKFITASVDGAEVLLSDGCLYDLREEKCEDLTVDEANVHRGGFQGILGAAEDLSRIYFVDTQPLTPPSEENANGEHAEPGSFNLFAWDNGATTFIGTLLEADNLFASQQYGDWKASPAPRTAQVSSDGRYLAFMSKASLTGYDNEVRVEECRGRVGGTLCSEVFEYDAASDTLTCVSCNPTGQRPLGQSNLSFIRPSEAFPLGPQRNNLSPEGSGRIFFESQDELSPRDTNGGVVDVYEWEPNGVGSCEQAKGCVHLLSGGQSSTSSLFVTSTPSGSDAFIATRAQLAPQDQGDQYDLYDVRVSGGIEESATAPCGGEACKGLLSGSPAQQGVGSSSFSGPGNQVSKHHKKHKRKKRHHRAKAKVGAANHNRGGAR